MKNYKYNLLLISILSLVMLMGCKDSEVKLRRELEGMILDYESKIIPLNKQIQLADYTAAISGKNEDYNTAVELQVKKLELYSNPEQFLRLKMIKNSGLITDSLLMRELDVLFNEFWYYQVPRENLIELIKKEKDIIQKFNIYRPELSKKQITDLQIEKVLSASTNSDELEQVWKASKQAGELVADDLVRLVILRNKAAEVIGFKNFYELKLILSGQDPSDVLAIYDELDRVTAEPYLQVKYEIDTYLSDLYKVPVDQLRPWHYQNRFFQSAPNIDNIDYDSYYKGKNIKHLASQYFKSIGLDIDDIINNSDWEEKSGKSQLGNVYDIDREGDIRILGNITDNYYSADKLMYECGYASYIKNIKRSLAYTLRQPSHFFVNDAIATFFSRFASNPEWLRQVVGISPDECNSISEKAKHALRNEKFVFSRWAQVVFRFEKSMYENPEQDLTALWWKLVAKYQLLSCTEYQNIPAWAAKTHLITMPCMYHNYMLGEILASQLFNYYHTKIINANTESVENEFSDPRLGKYLIESIFIYGMRYNWDQIVRRATGESLNPIYFQKQFVK